jgi:hypothetical protein
MTTFTYCSSSKLFYNINQLFIAKTTFILFFSGAASLWGAGAEQYRAAAAASAGVHSSGLFFSRRTQALLARLPQSGIWQSQIPGTCTLLQSTHGTARHITFFVIDKGKKYLHRGIFWIF